MSTDSGSFGTELPTMQQASQHVANVNQQIQGQLRDLMGRLEPLAGAWQGQAAASFQDLHRRWQENATRLNQALQGIGEGLAQSHQNYHTQEAGISHDITRVGTNLD
jgi:WXG100 family type VII secretion target